MGGCVTTSFVQANVALFGGSLARIPLARFGSTADVAASVAFLASDEAAYITGQVLSVDGGLGL